MNLPTETDHDVYALEQWAQEILATFIENTVTANLIHRDFVDMSVEVNDVVNIQKPTGGGCLVPFDLYAYTSFVIKDADTSEPFSKLAERMLMPASLCIAQVVDQDILNQIYKFSIDPDSGVRCLPNLNRDSLREACQILNDNQVPTTDRNLILGHTSEARLLKDCKLYAATEQLGFGAWLDKSIGFIANGELSFAFHRNAVVLGTAAVNRAPFTPGEKTIAIAHDGIGVQVTMAYNIKEQGIQATIEVLGGVALLDPALIVVFRS